MSNGSESFDFGRDSGDICSKPHHLISVDLEKSRASQLAFPAPEDAFSQGGGLDGTALWKVCGDCTSCIP